MFSPQESKSSDWLSLAGVTASVSQLKFRDITQITSILPKVQAVVQALFDVIQEVQNPETQKLQSHLRGFLQSTGFLAKKTSTKPLLDKIRVLHTATQALIKSIPAKIKPVTLGQTASLVDDLYTKIEPIIKPILTLTALYSQNQQLNLTKDVNNLVSALSQQNSMLTFFGWYNGLAFTASTTLLLGKITLIGQAIPPLLQLYQQKEVLQSFAGQAVVLCSSGEPWDKESILWRLAIVRLFDMWRKDPEIADMLHNLILVLATGLANKAGQTAGSALASAISLVLDPLVSILRLANYLTTPQALFSSFFKVLRQVAKKVRPGSEAQAGLQIIELLTGGLTLEAWLTMLASGPAILPIAGAALAEDQVRNLLRNKDQVLNLTFDIVTLLFVEEEERRQFPNGDPLLSKDASGFLSWLDPNNKDASLLGVAYEFMELRQAFSEGPSLQAQIFQNLFGSIGAVLGYENLLALSPENESEWLSFVPKITLSSQPSNPEVNKKSKEYWSAKQVEWKRIEDKAGGEIIRFQAEIEQLKTSIGVAPQDNLEGILIHTESLDTEIQKAETSALPSYNARILFDNNVDGSFRERASKELDKALEGRRLVFKKEEVAGQLQDHIDATIRYTSFIHTLGDPKSEESYLELQTFLNPTHRNFILNRVFPSYYDHITSNNWAGWISWAQTQYTKDTAKFTTEIQDFFEKIKGLQELVLGKKLSTEIIESLMELRLAAQKPKVEVEVNPPSQEQPLLPQPQPVAQDHEVKVEVMPSQEQSLLHQPQPVVQEPVVNSVAELKALERVPEEGNNNEDLTIAEQLTPHFDEESKKDNNEDESLNQELALEEPLPRNEAKTEPKSIQSKLKELEELTTSFPKLSEAKINFYKQGLNENGQLFLLPRSEKRKKKQSLDTSIELSLEVLKAVEALHKLDQGIRASSTEAKTLKNALITFNQHIKTQSIGRPGSCSKKLIGALLCLLGAALIILDATLGASSTISEGAMCIAGSIVSLNGGMLFFKGTKGAFPKALSSLEDNAKQAQNALLGG